ncbi:MAG: 6-carboxytetrahydropterin synthase [Sphingobacteriales bacterium]|nr:6-carboxytetrahydropterin synthase [Sphingobacteriales bacterium]MBI3720685.1 6-carboxytetrahydropterin synthase [Sphingobacteriales bacterium]
MAHAIDGYAGACKNIHGHSYELHVTVSGNDASGDDYIPAPGFILDFKELKKLMMRTVMDTFDHKLVLSRDYLSKKTDISSFENLVEWDVEPTAENLLIYIRKKLEKELPVTIKLNSLKIYETKDSYAEWINHHR